jgi:hypothetical protein
MIDIAVISIRPYQISDIDNLYEAVMESVHELQPFMPFGGRIW